MSATSGMTRTQAARQKKDLDRDRARALKQAARHKVLLLKNELKETLTTRRQAMREARLQCKRQRLAVRENAKQAILDSKRALKDARDHGKAAKVAACHACRFAKAAAKSLDPIARARVKLEAERSYQREIALLERHARERTRGTSRLAGSTRTRRSESDDEVRANLEPDMIALFDRVRGQIKATDRASRTENFLRYAEQHPHEVVNAIEHLSEKRIRELEKAHRHEQKRARRTKYTAAELEAVPF